VDDYGRACAALEDVWERTVGAADGPLPGSRLTALRTPQGWCGRVDRPAGEVQASVIAEAYSLPPGSVAVRGDGEHGAFVWAYRTAGGGDYHLAWPHPPLDGSEFVDVARESKGTSLLDLVRLTTWARSYQESWAALRTGGTVDMGQLVRRYTRLRAGILDLLPRTSPRQLRDLLLEVGVTREALPDDLAAMIEYPGGRDLTIPIPTWPGAMHLAAFTSEDLTFPH
jgi:hypothetical protein